MITNCLTFEQLQAYSMRTVNNAERGHLYMHISSCELCACAVNGFAALPFASDELVAIHREIDARTNATPANPLTFARLVIIAVCALSIAGVNALCDMHSKNNLQYSSSSLSKPISIPLKNETQKASKEEISSVTKTFKKIVHVMQYKTFERNITAIEKLDLIKPGGIRESSIVSTEANIITAQFDPDAIYIYDLKVSDYNNLYFSRPVIEPTLFKSHIPVYKENGKSKEEDADPEKRAIAADRILKNGLACFKKQDFSSAIESFEILLQNNQQDVNAQFYSALAYYDLDKTGKAMEYLDKVKANSNRAFYPEAEWFISLVTLKSGNREEAKQMLRNIVSEKGFYAVRAAEKLESL